MVKLTRNGVCYDLRNSPYVHTVQNEGGGRTLYHFSSELNRQRFESRILDNRQKINTTMGNKFNVKFKLNRLADIDLYTKVEKRGFYIVDNGRIIEWQDEIVISHEQVVRQP